MAADALQERKLLPPEEVGIVDPDAFVAGHVLSTSETAILLAQYEKERQQLSSTFQMPPVVRKTKEYVDKFRSCRNEESTTKIREMLIVRFGCYEYEVPVLANLMPETAEEAMTLVPSLKDPERFSEDKLNDMLGELASYRAFE